MVSPDRTKAARLAAIAVLLFSVIPLIGLLIWWRSLWGFAYCAVSAALVIFSAVRSRKMTEEEMIRRQDQAMNKLKDDANEMARWVP